MDLRQIRRLVIIGMFSDDIVMDQLVLKGGNALDIVYQIGSRTSLDVDLSMGKDFDDFEGVKERILRALKNRFSSAGYAVFDEKILVTSSPEGLDQNDKWGGYRVEFKLIERHKADLLTRDVARAQREALVIGPRQERTLRVHISKFEYCDGKQEAELDNYTIYVYTPAMIAIEKFRAICQQMPEYTLRRNPVARARDFYDIHSVITQAHLKLATSENLELFSCIFSAKEVPLILIPRIPDFREFHRPDWPSVESSVSGELKDFDFYFDFVVRQIPLLEPLWVE